MPCGREFEHEAGSMVQNDTTACVFEMFQLALEFERKMEGWRWAILVGVFGVSLSFVTLSSST